MIHVMINCIKQIRNDDRPTKVKCRTYSNVSRSTLHAGVHRLEVFIIYTHSTYAKWSKKTKYKVFFEKKIRLAILLVDPRFPRDNFAYVVWV